MTPPPADLLIEAADRWGTPLYVTDLDAAAAAGHAWRQALPGALVAYAVKANPDPALLRRLADDGFGFEVVGPVELALAIRAGCRPERIVVNGVGQTDADLALRALDASRRRVAPVDDDVAYLDPAASVNGARLERINRLGALTGSARNAATIRWASLVGERQACSPPRSASASVTR